jgi:hypothetical protein
MNMGNDQMFRSTCRLNLEGSLVEIRQYSKDAPANQQEGLAYDIRLNTQDAYHNLPDRVEDNKLSEIDNYEVEESKIVDGSRELDHTKKELKFPNTVIPVRSESIRSESMQPQEFCASADEGIEYKISVGKKIWNYMKDSSLFIFHESFAFRQWLIMIMISTEILTTKVPKSMIIKTNNEEGKLNKSTDQHGNDESDDSFDVVLDETM